MSDLIPPFSLARQHQALAPELAAALERVLASGQFTQGRECAAFEQEVAAWLRAEGMAPGVKAIVCASGTDALHLALRAAGAGPGDVVLTTPFTFFATAGAILLAGARPEFVDIDPETLNLDPALVEAALRQPRHGERVAAILPVHLFGRLAPMAEIAALAAAAGVAVIEDAAQALGSHRGSHWAGACGMAGCFSFYPTKNLGACGEGGMVTTSDPEMESRLRRLRVHGSRRRYQHELAGWNARMHEFQAAVLRAKLPHLASWNGRRRALAQLYHERLRALPEVALPEFEPGHVFHQYVIRIRGGAERRDALRQFLLERQIGTEIYYPTPLHLQPALAAYAPPGGLPAAERAAGEVLALPMFPELTDAEAARVADAVTAHCSLTTAH
ncbi:MAG TPA: DegT/DnrJ/EryC1/StrS family aminotransferase [Terriglobales bacterium]